MKRVLTQNLTPGMITGEDVYTYSDQLVIGKGIVLTDATITKLSYYSILSVMVEDNVAPAFSDNNPEESSYNEKLRATPEFKKFKADFEEETEHFKESMNDIVMKNAPVNSDALFDGVYGLVSNNSGNGTYPIFEMLHNMRTYDDVTYVHSMNVALINNIFARWLHLSSDEIRTATLCGLLHDIGKLAVSSEIIKKPSKLTDNEYAMIKEHPSSGYRILRSKNVNEHIINAALMHHERCDGSGYPLGLSLSKIDPYARMTAISDVYDATTSARSYRGPLCPFAVVGIFENEGLQKYDPGFIMTFLENIVSTYLLNTVRLNDGTTGQVVFINRNKLSKPTIQCGNDKFIDLSKEKDLEIEAII
ncbi:MAG: HD-GYP domain-containing protein [Lachnospiraceae bacterium]|nr:HD-GYP domain-containing protein [Lachnospiraceae bacterium]